MEYGFCFFGEGIKEFSDCFWFYLRGLKPKRKKVDCYRR